MAEDDFCTCRFPRLSFVRGTKLKLDGGCLTAYFSLKYLFREKCGPLHIRRGGQLNPTLPCRYGAGPTACGHADSQRWAGMYVSAEKVIIAGSKSVSCRACRPTNRKQGVAHQLQPSASLDLPSGCVNLHHGNHDAQSQCHYNLRLKRSFHHVALCALYRCVKPSTFTCNGCGQEKTSKLVAFTKDQ
jgi:hypothetical protein